MAIHNVLGKKGEDRAEELLITKGYAIRHKNWHKDGFEVDIVAMKGTRIIFVEVKTRTSDLYDPLQSITPKRIRHLVNAANAYVKIYNLPHEIQFDLILITGAKDGVDIANIEHIEDAFLPPLQTYR